jgi:hypothetical protein
MNTLVKLVIVSIVILTNSACTHMRGNYTKGYSIPIEVIENSPLKLSIVDGRPVAILDGKIISSPVEFPDTLVSADNKDKKSVSIQSIEQFSLIKIKGSCYYFFCAGSSCSKFVVDDSWCP